jgi:protein TonB
MLAITPAEPLRTRFTAMLIALALHGAFIAVAASLHRAHPLPAPPLITELLEIEAPPIAAPEPPTPAAPSPVAPARAATAPRTSRIASTPLPERPSPEPAAAAEEEILDFGATLVTSTASSSSFATKPGSARGSTAHGAPRAAAARQAAGTGTSDLSRAAALAGTTEWRCPFPLEADGAAIDHAVVTLRIDVAATGKVLRAHTIDDPGYGFADKARACALRKRFAPALDRTGTPMRATATVHVTFDR